MSDRTVQNFRHFGNPKSAKYEKFAILTSMQWVIISMCILHIAKIHPHFIENYQLTDLNTKNVTHFQTRKSVKFEEKTLNFDFRGS